MQTRQVVNAGDHPIFIEGHGIVPPTGRPNTVPAEGPEGEQVDFLVAAGALLEHEAARGADNADEEDE